VAESSIFGASEADERRIADALGLPDAGGWTGYAPLPGARGAIDVVVGRDFLGGDVSVFEASGRPNLSLAVEAMLQDSDLRLSASGSFGPKAGRAHTRVVGRDPSDDPLIARTRAALGLPAGAPEYATETERDPYMDGARVLVLIGRDFRPPEPYRSRLAAGQYRLPAYPTEVKVLVRNATGSPTGDDDVVARLRSAGFMVTTTRMPEPGPRSQIDYTAGNEDTARDVAQKLDLESVRRVAVFGDVGDLDVIVTLGSS
jgi:hypothetical protein